MSRADEAFRRLASATVDTDPACKDDDRFVAEELPAHTLASICRSCPLFDPCAAYAELGRPKGGIWAGKRYRVNGHPRGGDN